MRPIGLNFPINKIRRLVLTRTASRDGVTAVSGMLGFISGSTIR